MRTESHLGVLFFVAHRSMEQRVLLAVNEAGHKITVSQARVFARIDEAGTRLTELAELAQVTKQTAGFLVDQLEKAGYVERVPDPSDARARLIRIAPRGRDVQAIAIEVEADIQKEWTAHLGRDTMHQLDAAMRRLREITDFRVAKD